MTEMKEKIYLTLPTIQESPTAPAIELTEMGNDQGHTYRLKQYLMFRNFWKKKSVSVKHLVKNIFVLRELLVI